MIIVTAAHDRRRAGRFFPKGQPVHLDPGELSQEEADAIMGDPVLHVVRDAASEVPLSPKERHEVLVAILPDLGDEDRNKDGTPNLGRLSALVDFKVTKDELKAALVAIEAEKPAD